jgi:hypothetical protein
MLLKLFIMRCLLNVTVDTALLHLFSKYCVLIGNIDLLLKPFLFVSEFLNPIFHHLLLHNLVNPIFLTSICLYLSISFSLNLPLPAIPVALFLAFGELSLSIAIFPKPK